MIAEAPPDNVVDEGWLAVRIDDDVEIATAVSTLHRDEVHGVILFNNSGRDLWKAFSAGYKFVQAAGGVVLDEQDRLLAIRRLGKWDLPKGKVDHGETIEAAALREVREECGIEQLTIISPLTESWHTYERKGRQHLKCTSWFLMRGSSHDKLTAQADENIEEARWLDEEELKAMEQDTYSSLLPVLDAFKRMKS